MKTQADICSNDCNHVICSFLKPFIRVYPYVLAKPLSKKMPKGTLSNRNGLTSIEVFCNEYQALLANWPSCDYDFNEAFVLKDKLFNQVS